MNDKVELIKFVRGDTLSFKLPISYADGTPIPEASFKEVFVTARVNPIKSSEILFQKNINDIIIEDEYIRVVFEPKDTENLEYGIYACDVEVTLTNGVRKTKYFNFQITDETTINGG